MTLVLRPFAPGDEAAALAAHEVLAAERFTFLLGYDPTMTWAEWLAATERGRTPAGAAPHMVPSTLLAADVGGDLVGRVSVRFSLNEWLARQGGHIGYAVLPAHRRRGYATEILRRGLDVARDGGVGAVLVVCDESNVGSAAVIERCGGVLEGRGVADDGGPIRRYWVPAPAGGAVSAPG